MSINYLVFEGGGVKGIAYAGAYKYLHSHDLIPNLKGVAGTSAGAISATLVAMKCKPEDIASILTNLDFNKFKDTKSGVFKNLLQFTKEYGWYSGDYFYSWMSNIIEQCGYPEDITFKQLYEDTGISLNILGTNVTKGQSRVFDHIADPEMEVRLAVRISMSIPIFFKSIKYKGNIYVDGGVLNNYPMSVFDKADGVVLGFRVDSRTERDSIHSNLVETDTSNIIKFGVSLVTVMHERLQRRHVSSMDWDRTISIDSHDISSINFNLSREEKYLLYTSGFEHTKRALNS